MAVRDDRCSKYAPPPASFLTVREPEGLGQSGDRFLARYLWLPGERNAAVCDVDPLSMRARPALPMKSAIPLTSPPINSMQGDWLVRVHHPARGVPDVVVPRRLRINIHPYPGHHPDDPGRVSACSRTTCRRAACTFITPCPGIILLIIGALMAIRGPESPWIEIAGVLIEIGTSLILDEFRVDPASGGGRPGTQRRQGPHLRRIGRALRLVDRLRECSASVRLGVDDLDGRRPLPSGSP